MPEAAEVKLSADLISKKLIDQNIVNVFCGKSSRYKINRPEGFNLFVNRLCNSPIKIQDINTKGKFMYWSFEDDWYMFCTFGMTGQWVYKEDKHTCLGIYFGKNAYEYKDIYFNDPRHFGTIKFTNNKKDLEDKLNSLGWDPFNGLSEEDFNFVYEKCQSKKPIGQILLNQSIFCGVGNYIRAESLYRAKISPWRLGIDLSKDEIKNLCREITNIVNEAYRNNGATISTYKTSNGDKGLYSDFFKVYKRRKDFLGNDIIKERTPEGRSIYWCPYIQK